MTRLEAMLILLILAVQWAPAACEDEHDHDTHGGKDAFEWAGIFETPESTYLWTAQKTKSGDKVKYADATMKIAVLPANAATDAALHALEKEGNHALEEECTEVLSGGIITPMLDKCYVLKFKENWWQSLYTIDATGQKHLAFFTEHFPTEFENTAHYLKDDHGDDIEPVAELPEESATSPTTAPEEEDPWGPAIGTAIIVNIVTLIGVVFLVPALSAMAKSHAAEFDCLTSAFAAGAISACAFFLLLFESTHLISEGHPEEVQQIWRWGTMILAGVLFPAITQMVSELIIGKLHSNSTFDFDKAAEATEVVPQSQRVRVMSGVLIGDFMHNLCDGFFIGAAFKGCGTSFGWTVAGGTIAHELSQELADYVILTGKICKLHPALALGLNFLSGTSVLLGVVIVLSSDISNVDIGLLLAFGGGVYLYIALVECMPKLHSAEVSCKIRALGVFIFLLGAIAIGLVLLDHEHCVPPLPPGAEPAAGGHAGHGH